MIKTKKIPRNRQPVRSVVKSQLYQIFFPMNNNPEILNEVNSRLLSLINNSKRYYINVDSLIKTLERINNKK